MVLCVYTEYIVNNVIDSTVKLRYFRPEAMLVYSVS